jgi:1-deoxy-D-xylulose-5-phosphate reductoisomerase
MGTPDMRHPIQHALTYPKKLNSSLEFFDLAKLSNLSFEVPDSHKYPSLDFAYESLKVGGTLPAVMNAANEVAVDAFRSGEIGFKDIWNIVEFTMERHSSIVEFTLDDVMSADAEARRLARERIVAISND